MLSVKPQFLIGAAASGSGKTTFTMGLLRVRNHSILRLDTHFP